MKWNSLDLVPKFGEEIILVSKESEKILSFTFSSDYYTDEELIDYWELNKKLFDRWISKEDFMKEVFKD